MFCDMATRKADRYPITPEWRAAVRRELDKRPRGAMAQLAKAIGASSGQVSEMLSDESAYSRYVGAVNKFFGWAPPPPPPASHDHEEITALISSLGADIKDTLRALKEMPKDERQAHMRLIILNAKRRSSD